jgi:hypothetical protein
MTERGRTTKAEGPTELAAPVRRKAEAPSNDMLKLQASAGNQAVLAMLGAQAKLTVGHVDDPAEREADAIAAQVVGALNDSAAATDATPAPIGRIARKIRRRASGPKPIGAEGGDVDPGTEQALKSARSGGAAMPGDVRRSMETAFGADFSGVKVHTGAKADELNRSMGAQAFTVDNDIFFSGGMPDTSTKAGAGLLAHELTHTVQQGSAPVSRTIRREPGEEAEAPEEETSEAPSEASPEAEAGESETTETETTEGESEGEGLLVKGTLPKEEFELAALGPPPGVEGDRPDASSRRSGSRRAAPDGPSSAGGGVRIVVGDIGLSTSTKRNDSIVGSAAEEDSVYSYPTVTGGITSGLVVTPFGAMQPTMEFKDAKYEAKVGWFAGNYVQITLNIAGDAQWGTIPANGVADVPSATSNVVTADTYEQIAADLTPRKIEKSWRAPRTKYWSDAICQRHEKYHATDFQKWLKSKGSNIVRDELNAQTVELDPTERLDPAQIQEKLKNKMKAAKVKLIQGYNAYMQGDPVASYLSMPCEERAFGDGKVPYQTLAAAVTAQGVKLKAAAAKKAPVTT